MDNLVIRKYINDDFNTVIDLLKEHFNISNNIESLEDSINSFGIVTTLNNKVIGYIRVDKLKNIGKNNMKKKTRNCQRQMNIYKI